MDVSPAELQWGRESHSVEYAMRRGTLSYSWSAVCKDVQGKGDGKDTPPPLGGSCIPLILLQHSPDFIGEGFLGEGFFDELHTLVQHTMVGDDVGGVA